MSTIKNVWRNIKDLLSFNINQLAVFHERQLLATGKLLSQNVRAMTNPTLKQVEFSIFSQWGDDGIIQYLINNVPISNTIFIEFGVENYAEANTRFLLLNDNWKGLIIDGSKANMEYVRKSNLYWKYELTAVDCFITRDNINTIFKENGYQGPIGLLSIDVDGNDYWIWETISVVDADIVVVEYNSVFGEKHAVTVPYDDKFIRSNSHYSNLYWGASLKAFLLLAKRKGYSFVGCNSNGNNAYFVKSEKAASLKEVSLKNGFVQSRFRESLNERGELDFYEGIERVKKIANKEVFDVEQNRMIKLSEILINY
jgi:hypothetical protein